MPSATPLPPAAGLSGETSDASRQVDFLPPPAGNALPSPQGGGNANLPILPRRTTTSFPGQPCPEREKGRAPEAGAFVGLESAGTLLLAVSGGPDSIALLLMAARWAQGLGAAAPALHVATVDHGLRPEARDEAALVAATATAWGLPHETLVWTGPKPSSRIQERARKARYALLADHARTIGATHVLTAHHADDQAETVLLRLGRGSGLDGLAGMRRLTPLAANLVLARPLLDRTKAELVAICQANGCDVVDDPSNRDPVYARSRLRAEAPALAALGLDTPGLLRLARRMARAEAALEAETDRVEDGLDSERGPGFFRAGLTQAVAIVPEIGVRLMRRAIASVANSAIRLDRLESLTDIVWCALRDGRPYRATLAGTRVTLDRHGMLEVSEEADRRRGRPRTRSSRRH